MEYGLGPFLELDPVWTDAFMATGMPIYGRSVLTPKEVEHLSIAFDASYTHMYAPGTRRHINGALNAGATVEEIMEVFEALRRSGRAGLQLRFSDPCGGTVPA
jgi:alkylhydroperoxidase/carboxymuconolactone decarboxylase family protein YurZ